MHRMSLNSTPTRALHGSSQNLAGVEGVEPANAGIKIRCLNQLGDTPTQDRCTTFTAIQPTYNYISATPKKLPPFKGMNLQITAFADFEAIWMA